MLKRRKAIATLLAKRSKDLFIVPGLGSTTYDVASLGDDERDFYLWGAMGGAVMIGLGVALAQPKRKVAVITGDGEMLMGIGSLATAGVQCPPNLGIIVFDNGQYGETGQQASHTHVSNTHAGVDLPAVARACGIAETREVASEKELAALADLLGSFDRMFFARVKIAPEEAPRVLPVRDGVALKHRFRRAMGVGEKGL
jgi:thiamine pyrophosphate-dependent acetolactate synthase large subunit-like protein